MSPSRHKLLPLLISALLSAPAGAVGLGDIELHSGLGKPLQAEIPLSHLGDLGLEQVRVGLGSDEDYARLGVERTYQHTLIRLEPFLKDGRAYVRLATRDPVAEPYLNFVLNLRWPQGQVAREYTVLLDPPEHAAALAAATAPQAQPVAAAGNDAAPAASRTAAPPAPVGAAAAESAAAADGAYTVRPGDSLWRLAARWRPAGVGVERMMGAIHAANPAAFAAGDPARLRAASTLRIPSAEQIAAAAPVEAAPAAAPAPARAVATEPAPAEPAPIPATITTGSRDEELVAENAALKSQVAELSTSVASLTDDLGASQDRLHALEAKIGALVDQLERQRVATQALASAAGVAQPNPESLVNNAVAGDLLAPAPAKTPWWVHAGYWAAIAALGAWAAFAARWRRRQPLPLAAPHDETSARARGEIEARLAAAPLAPAGRAGYWHPQGDAGAIDDLPLDLVEPRAEPARPAAERPSFADATVTRTAEDAVDPIISAGVFTAFGRYDDAEQVLSEALQRQPERVDLKLHLLDVYKHLDQRDAFTALADQIAREHADDAATLQELAGLRADYLA